MIPYSTSFIGEDDIAAVEKVLRSNWLTRGEYQRRFEEAMCELTGKKYALAVSNGSVALWMALSTCNEMETYSPTLTYSAVANASELHNGQIPTLFDVDEDTCCTDWSKHAGLDGAVVAMDYAGYPGLRNVPPHFVGKVILDAAHSLGATIKGESNTKLADIATFSYHPAKLVCAGEGGAIVTDNEYLHDTMWALRNNGIDKNGLKVSIGTNGHMDEMSCALALSQLKRLKQSIQRRHEIAQMYYKAWDGDNRIILPVYDEGHAFHLFVIRVSESVSADIETIRGEMKDIGVATQRHYRPLHLQPVYQHWNFQGLYPIAEHIYERAISIPMYYGLKDYEIKTVITAVERSLDRHAK